MPRSALEPACGLGSVSPPGPITEIGRGLDDPRSVRAARCPVVHTCTL